MQWWLPFLYLWRRNHIYLCKSKPFRFCKLAFIYGTTLKPTTVALQRIKLSFILRPYFHSSRLRCPFTPALSPLPQEGQQWRWTPRGRAGGPAWDRALSVNSNQTVRGISHPSLSLSLSHALSTTTPLPHTPPVCLLILKHTLQTRQTEMHRDLYSSFYFLWIPPSLPTPSKPNTGFCTESICTSVALNPALETCVTPPPSRLHDDVSCLRSSTHLFEVIHSPGWLDP